MARKASDLAALIRLRKWILDERQRELAALTAREEQLIQYGRELERQLVREGQIALADPTSAGFMFGAFAEGHKKRRERLAITLAAVRKEIEEARERLAEAYRERKTLEEVQKARAIRERTEADRIEQAELDEVAQNQHRMKG